MGFPDSETLMHQSDLLSMKEQTRPAWDSFQVPTLETPENLTGVIRQYMAQSIQKRGPSVGVRVKCGCNSQPPKQDGACI